MLRLCVLNSVVPKLRPKNEKLDARTRNWFSDGYRAAAPGTSTCRTDSDCEFSEICQGGYCAGIHLNYGTYGLYSDTEYRSILAKDHPYGFLMHSQQYMPYHHFYSTPDAGTINRPLHHFIDMNQANQYRDYEYDHDYNY